MTKDRPTATEHQHIGDQLKATREELIHIWVFLSRKYPHSARHIQKMKQAIACLDSTKCALDGAAAREHPNEFRTDWYYGPSSGQPAHNGDEDDR